MAKTHEQAGFLVERNGVRSFFAVKAEAKKYAKFVNAVARPTVATFTEGSLIAIFDGKPNKGEFQILRFEMRPKTPVIDKVRIEDARKAVLAAKESRDRAQGLLNEAVALLTITLPELPDSWDSIPNDVANRHYYDMEPRDHDDHALIQAEYIYKHLDEIEATIVENLTQRA